MIPKTLSATSLQTANLCMARWVAENLEFTPGISLHSAADTGSTCHEALEKFVRDCYIDKTKEPTWELLKTYLEMSYIGIFKDANFKSDEFKDAESMLRRWWKRNEDYLPSVEIVSVEEKRRMPVPAVKDDGEKIQIPFTYIIDRLDRNAPGEYTVVDYKSVRMPIQPDELTEKIQARIYALAVQIQFPDAEKIRVVFDLLRYDEVGIVVTRDENVAFWSRLKAEVQRIVSFKREDVQPTLNSECGYCVIKAQCVALQRNIDHGGIHSLSIDEMMDLQVRLMAQAKGAQALVGEIEELLLRHAAETDQLKWRNEDGRIQVEIGVSGRRQADHARIAEIIGPDLFAKQGKLTMAVIDNMLSDPSLTDEQKAGIQAAITKTYGDPKPKIKQINTIT